MVQVVFVSKPRNICFRLLHIYKEAAALFLDCIQTIGCQLVRRVRGIRPYRKHTIYTLVCINQHLL